MNVSGAGDCACPAHRTNSTTCHRRFDHSDETLTYARQANRHEWIVGGAKRFGLARGCRSAALFKKRGDMFTAVSYDVVDDKRRTRVLKLLRGYGTYVQYSVFE